MIDDLGEGGPWRLNPGKAPLCHRAVSLALFSFRTLRQGLPELFMLALEFTQVDLDLVVSCLNLLSGWY